MGGFESRRGESKVRAGFLQPKEVPATSWVMQREKKLALSLSARPAFTSLLKGTQEMLITAPQLKPPHITHLVGPDEDGRVIVVMCLKMKGSKINPDHATWSQEAPSCVVCHRKYEELKPYPHQRSA